MAYVIVDSSNRIQSFGGVVLTFDTEENALASISGESSLTAGKTVKLLGEALSAERKMHAEALSNAHRAFVELQHAVEKHLDAVDGAMDVEEFIEEHRELAEAIGYEFEEDVDFILEVRVTGKKSRAVDLEDVIFEVNVDTMYGEIEGIEVDSISVQ